MLCAHTVRRLKPGAFEPFTAAFVPTAEDGAHPGWLRFYLLRNLADPDQVVTFGFFDGTLDELKRSQHDADFQSRRDAIEPLVETVIANGVYEVVATRVRDEVAPR